MLYIPALSNDIVQSSLLPPLFKVTCQRRPRLPLGAPFSKPDANGAPMQAHSQVRLCASIDIVPVIHALSPC